MSCRKEWKDLFGLAVKTLVSIYNVSDSSFAEETGCNSSTLRRWKEGSRIPNDDNFNRFIDCLRKNSDSSNTQLTYYFTVMREGFSKYQSQNIYEQIVTNEKKDLETAIRLMKYCADVAKGKISPFNNEMLEKEKSTNQFVSQNKIRAIVFDFDGTLTKTDNPIVKTTWESIWISLGYDVRECQNLHKKFDRKEISHSQWCSLTEDKFKERHLQKNVLHSIAQGIKLIDGVEDTFLELWKKNIKIYIVSGSIKLIIQMVLGPLNEYVESIRANVFDFDEDDYLTRIIGTKFDFEGKATYIRMIAEELQISTQDILFVGNSRNDQFAYQSGAKTLCINPQLTDMTNTMIWNDCIETCNSLTEILGYIA